MTNLCCMLCRLNWYRANHNIETFLSLDPNPDIPGVQMPTMGIWPTVSYGCSYLACLCLALCSQTLILLSVRTIFPVRTIIFHVHRTEESTNRVTAVPAV